VAYDEELAGQVRELLSGRPDLSEREMFGGIGFLLRGNMAVGVVEDELVIRLDPVEAETALRDEHARPFDYSGRPMKGWVYVSGTAASDPDKLAGWVEEGADFALTLPAKG